jgi:hypothetical protein
MTTIELVGLITNVLASLGVIGALVALIWQFRSFRREQHIALREATLPFFRAWWGAENWLETEEITVPQLRAAFYGLVGSPNEKPEDSILAKLAKLQNESEAAGGYFGLGQAGGRLKELVEQGKVPNTLRDTDHLRKLTFFYDMIGWLGAHGLIDVDYILGPMQHHMRRTWWVAKVLIERDRQRRGDYWLDPVRHLGFQWLFEYSEKRNQVAIIEDRFSGLSIINDENMEVLKRDIQDDEKLFKTHLRKAGWPIGDGNA